MLISGHAGSTRGEACRQAVYRIRYKATNEAALSEKYERISAAVRKRVTLEQGTERERSAPEPSERNVEEQRRPSEPAEAAPDTAPGISLLMEWWTIHHRGS